MAPNTVNSRPTSVWNTAQSCHASWSGAVPGDMQFQTRKYRQRKKKHQYRIHKEYKPFFVHRFLIAK